jgi:hypothetical protein
VRRSVSLLDKSGSAEGVASPRRTPRFIEATTSQPQPKEGTRAKRACPLFLAGSAQHFPRKLSE